VKRFLAICALGAALAVPAATASSQKVVFQGVMVAASSVGPGGIVVGINVGCTGANHWSTNLNLVLTTGGNQSFFHKTVTGTVSGNRGKGNVTYTGKVPATGFAAVVSNTFCWQGSNKSMGVGYRDIVYCAVAGTQRGRCQVAQPTSYKP